MKIQLLACAALILSSITAQAAIFGPDDRAYVTSTSTSTLLARATAVAVLSSLHEESSPGKIKLHASSLAGEVCSDEKFAQDPTLPWACTGFLVAPNLIATAGHCMVNVGESRNETETYCQAFSWLFDYQVDKNGKAELENIPAEKLYKCKQVIYAVRDEQAPFRDYALVELDRPVTDREPLKLVTDAPKGNLTMIGHPLGTPKKISRVGHVLLDDRKRESFITSLDAFEGNSGSPVFNSRSEVVGILVAGTPSISLIKDESRSCQRYNRCDQNAKNCKLPDKDNSVFPGFQAVGSEVQRIAPVIELIKSFQKK